MFMTEQGAGSDVGATATVARRDGAGWALWGDKWFCSNADADLALVLARPEGGGPGTKSLSLFLLPRRLPDGAPSEPPWFQRRIDFTIPVRYSYARIYNEPTHA